MDTDRLEVIGLDPLRDLLKEFGGWPVVEGAEWNEDAFDWLVHASYGAFELLFRFRREFCGDGDGRGRRARCRRY